MDRAFSPLYIHILKPGALPQAGMGSGRWPWVGGIDSHTWGVAPGWYGFVPLALWWGDFYLKNWNSFQGNLCVAPHGARVLGVTIEPRVYTLGY